MTVVPVLNDPGSSLRTLRVALASIALAVLAHAPAAEAAVGLLGGGWTRVGNGTTTVSGAKAADAGANRILVVAIGAKYATAQASFPVTVTWGGRPVTAVASSAGSTTQKAWVGILRESEIAAASGTTLSVSVTSGTPTALVVDAAFYGGVDQAAPVNDTSSSASDTAATAIPYGKALAFDAGGAVINVVSVAGNTGLTPPAGYVERRDASDSATNNMHLGVGEMVSASAGSANSTVTAATAQRYALAVMALEPSPVATYRWQLAGAASYGGFTTSWTSCTTLSGNTQRRVVMMNGNAFTSCASGGVSTRQSGPFEMLVAVRDTAYGADTLVTGGSAGTSRFSFLKGVSSQKVRFALGYAKGGVFEGWGSVEVPITASGVVQPDLSFVSGVAPAGSNLALQIVLLENSAGSTSTVYYDDSRGVAGEDSGTVTVSEYPVGTLALVDAGASEIDTTIAPGSATPTVLDAFSVSTTAGVAPIFKVTLVFDEGTAAALQTVAVTDASGTVLGSVTTPDKDTFDVALSTPIRATVTPTEYQVRITPRPRAALPPDTAWVVRGRVLAIETPLAETVSDGDSARVLVDDLPPSAPTALAGVAQSGKVTLGWRPPIAADLLQTVVFRSTTGSFGFTPPAGTVYAADQVGQTFGDGVLACVAPAGAQACTDAVANGGTYWYRAFATDAYGNWSAASAIAGPLRPAATLTVAEGASRVPAATICPAPTGGAAPVDAFAVQVSPDAAPDVVTALTVDLASGTSQRVARVELVDAGGAVVATQTAPSGDRWSFTGLAIPAPVEPAATQLTVRITPKAHDQLGPRPGTTYAVTARVSGATAATVQNVAVLDAADGTIAIDHLSPALPTSVVATAASGRVDLAWANPADATSALVLRGTAPVAEIPANGATYAPGPFGASVVVCAGNVATCADTGLADGTTYRYAVFVRDACANWTDVGAAAHATPGVAAIATVTLTAPDVAQPSTGLARGAAPAVVGRVKLVATSGAVTVTSLAIENVASAPQLSPATDVVSVVLLDDATSEVLEVGRWNGAGWTFPDLAFRVTTAAPRTVRVALALARDATVGRKFQLRARAAGVTAVAPGVVAGGPIVGQELTVAAADLAEGTLEANSLAPQVTVMNPAPGAVSGRFKLQVHVWNPNTTSNGTIAGTADLTAVDYTLDGSAPACAAKTLVENPRYRIGGRAGIFEKELDPGQGTYTIRACAKNGAGKYSYSRAITIVVGSPGRGDGNLLVRDNSTLLCTDCHALRTHSSQTTRRNTGTWSTTCRDCHTPHGTSNVYLVQDRITPPSHNGVQGTREVRFARAKSGDAGAGDSGVDGAADPANASFVNRDGTGVCQVCHTKTTNPWDPSVRRFQAGGNDDTHYTRQAGTKACSECHKHVNGFSPESRGGASCEACHDKIWKRMTGAVAVGSAHRLGSVAATNAAAVDDPTVTWAEPLATTQPAAKRSCLNMCHPDKRHNQPGGWDHSFAVYNDARTAASRAVTRGEDGEIVTGDVSDTDFDATKPTGGMCTSCHQNAVTDPVNGIKIDKASYAGGAHDFDDDAGGLGGTWYLTQRDGSRFRRNCTKCHSDRADRQPSDDTYPFGVVHYSDYPKLLSGSLKPGQDGIGVFVCYNCHGNGTVGQNRSNDIASVSTELYAHPVNSDKDHLLGDAEYVAAQWGNRFGGVNRHASCLDCHNTHTARRGGHTYQVGTIAVNVAAKTLTGTGTRWSDFYNGARFRLNTWPATTWCTIGTVSSPTAATITGTCTGTTGSGAYRIEQLTNKAGPAINGAWGVVFPATALAAGAAPNGAQYFAKKKLATNVDNESYLCFKCHSAFFWGDTTTAGTANAPPPARSGFTYYVGTASFTNGSANVTGVGTAWRPTGNTDLYVNALIRKAGDTDWYKISAVGSATGLTLAAPYAGTTQAGADYIIQMTHTDQAREFNPANKAFHPVLASAQNNLGATSNIKAPWSRSSVMTCTDCHESDASNDPNGPHGSAYRFMLKGPNRLWDETVGLSSSGMPAGTFCINCHNADFTNSRFPQHITVSDHRSRKCFDCHVAIPHGSSTVGLLVNGNGSGFSDKTSPYDQARNSTRLYVLSNPSSNTSNWSRSNCGCGSNSPHG